MVEEFKERKPNSRIIIPILSIALIASLAWGYSQFRFKRNWEIRAENQYNRSYSELALHVGELEAQLGKAMVSNTPDRLTQIFTDIWRQANMSQEDIGQLPLASVEMSQTKNFLAKVTAFSFDMAQQCLNNKVLSDKQWGVVSDLHNRSQLISAGLIDLQERIMEGDERWLNVDRLEMASAAADVSQRLETNKVTKSFLMLEDGLKRLPDPEFEGNPLNFKPTPKGLTGSPVNVEQAREIALKFFDRNGERYRADYEGQIKGDFPSYLFNIIEVNDNDRKKEAEKARIAVSTKGGHVMWMLKNRIVEEEDLPLEEAGNRAIEYLNERDYPDLVAVATDNFRNIAVVNLVRKVNDIKIYPELFKVQVALDNGEILGVEAIPYLTFHDPNRKIMEAKLSMAANKEKINPHVKLEKTNKAIILNDKFQEVMCYENYVNLKDDRYIVYINAANGEEEKIKRINENGVEIE